MDAKKLFAIKAKVHFENVFLKMQTIFDDSYFMKKALQEAEIAYE